MIKSTGGAQIGWVNATWPLASLSVTNDRLFLEVAFIGKYSFTPDQVTSVERYGFIPFWAWGIRIHHTVAEYPERIIFWCFLNPSRLIDRIREVGFLAQGTESKITRRGIPAKPEILVLVVILWNILFYLDQRHNNIPGPFSLTALGIVFLLSTLTQRSRIFQKFILKSGRDISEIQPYLRLLSLVTGFLLLGTLIFYIAK